MLRLLYVVLLWLTVTEALPGRVKRVVNGEILERGKWPWLVSLHYLQPADFTAITKMKHVCGGTLIHPQWVMTAAHCVEAAVVAGGPLPGNWEIVLGEHNQYIEDEGEQIMKVESIHQHPDFNFSNTKNLLFDIALMKLTTPAKMTDYVDVIELYTEHTRPPAKTPCQIGGWGQVSEEPFGYPMFIPFKTTVYLITNGRCRRSYPSKVNEDWLDYKVDNTVVCAGTLKRNKGSEYGNGDACNGDSGGPLVCDTGSNGKQQVVGVVSTGKGCGVAQFPGIYTSVTVFQDWIRQTMAESQMSGDSS